MRKFPTFILIVLFTLSFNRALGQEPVSDDFNAEIIAAQAHLRGNPKRGALIFYKSAAACIKCHAVGEDINPLGPDLTTIQQATTDVQIVESLLNPSKVIRKGYETITIITNDGKSYSGIIARATEQQIVLRDAANLEQEIVIERDQVEEEIISKKSMMPEGLVGSISDKKDLYDLVRYVIDIARGGKQRAQQLQPAPEQLVIVNDTINLDHAGIIRSLGERDIQEGQRIFLGHCANCHGTDGNQPTLPTARAFGKDPLKYGADPYRMLMTLTNGAGLMAAMQHLTPRERYQVIYYIRESLMKTKNPVYQDIDESYLSQLPEGEDQGDFVSTVERDYGPVLGSQIGTSVNNALTFRFDDEITFSYDLHRMKSAGAWQGGFLDLTQTHHYRQRGERMPQVDGELLPGLSDWQWSFDGGFDIPKSMKPPRGPIHSDWLQYYGHYLYGNHAILSYGIHGRKILETVNAMSVDEFAVLSHSMRIAAGDQPLKLCVAKLLQKDSPSGVVPFGSMKIQKVQSSKVHKTIAMITGQDDRRQARPRMANRHWHMLAPQQSRELDLGTPGRTILVRFRTTASGTLIASTPENGEWKPHGKTLFIRGGKLVFDIGWVGAIQSTTDVADGRWHLASIVVSQETTKLYVDGKLEAQRDKFRRAPENGHVLKIGATSTNFGGDYRGDIEWIRIYNSELSEEKLKEIYATWKINKTGLLFQWDTPATIVESNRQNNRDEGNGSDLSWDADVMLAAVAVSGHVHGMKWEFDHTGRIILNIPASTESRLINIIRSSGTGDRFDELCNRIEQTTEKEYLDPASMLQGGPTRWPEKLKVSGEQGEPINGYALDTISVPFDNPWNAWLRTSSLDFMDDGRAVVTTHGGDVYLVDGLDDELNHVTWKRYAAGLFEPFGVRVLNNQIYVTCRDGLKRLHDYDENDEADFVEAFWIDDDVSCRFHAYNFDLQTDSSGNFYFAKAGQYTQHHRPGTIMKIPPEGGEAEVFAWGLRTPNGMGKLFDDRFTVSDNQGPWMPAGKISLIKPESFLGNMPINEEQHNWLVDRHGGRLPDNFEEPFIWMPQELDNSCGGQVWVDDPRFGPLSGRLIHSSFGKGWLYYLSLQQVAAKAQASIVSLPHQWDAGVMRLRINPYDGQLYGTGLSGWQGPRNGKDGCLQRLRYTGQPTRIIERTRVIPGGLELTFNFAIDEESACHPENWDCQMWDYLWSKRYGSDQFSVLNPGEQGRDHLQIENIELHSDRILRLSIPKLSVCDQLSLEMKFNDAESKTFIEHAYLTIHAIPE